MSRIELAPEVGEDFDRILDHLVRYGVEDPASRIREIVLAIDVLEHNPLIGRPIAGEKKELVIGRRSRGYVALYRYVRGDRHGLRACTAEPAGGRIYEGVI